MLRSLLFSFLSEECADMDLLSVAGWAYLVLGISSGVGLLIGAGLSLLSGNGMLYGWSTVLWAVAIFALSGTGWMVLRHLRTIESWVGAVLQKRQHS